MKDSVLKELLLFQENFDSEQRELVAKHIFPIKTSNIENIINPLLAVLPSQHELPELIGKRCAVVGNGSSILREKQGKVIDDHDVVIRMNEIQMKDHAEYTGTRTSIHLFNEGRGKKAMQGRLPSHGAITILCGPTNEHHSYEIYIQAMEAKRRPATYLLKPSLRLEIAGKHPRRPSAGFISVYLAREMGLEVNLFGFNMDGTTGRLFGERQFYSRHHAAHYEYETYRRWSNDRFNIY